MSVWNIKKMLMLVSLLLEKHSVSG